MTTQYLRTNAAWFGLATLLSGGLALAQPTSDAAPPVAEPAAPIAPTSTTTAETNQPAAAVTPAPAAPTAAPAPATMNPTATAQPAPVSDVGPATLIHSGASVGGFGHLDVAYTRLAGKNAALFCGGGALLVDHRFSLGLVGCGNASRISGQGYGNVMHEAGDRLEFGYGGLVLGYHFFPKQLYNLAFTTMVGGGATAIANYRDSNGGDWSSDERVKTHDTLFVVEPRLTGYINLTRWARMGAFAGYRLVTGSNMQNLSNSDLAGPVAGGTLQLGWF